MASSIINTNIAATRTHNIYNRNNDYMNAAMTRVATGMRINSAKDGASTWAISEKMRERMRANDQANQNVQNDTAMLKVAQGGIGNTIDILTTLKERAINAANDSNLNTDRSRIAAEVYQLVEQINDNAVKVKFNGRTLLNGGIGDETTGTFTPVAESGGSSSSTTVTPTVATSNQVAGEAAHTFTVFSLGSSNDIYNEFKKASSATALAVSAGTEKLTELFAGKDSSGAAISTIANSEKAFQVGDKITLSAVVDGSKKSVDVTVDNTTTWASLSTDLSAIDNSVTVSKVVAKNTANYGASTLVLKATDASGTATGTAINTPNTGTAGMFVLGTQGHTLNNVSISITHADGTVNEYAQKALNAQNATYNGYIPASTTTTNSSDALTFYVGGEANFGIDVTINAMNSTGLGLGDSETFAKGFLTKSGAESAIATIDSALNTALNEQTRLGAFEARLGYTSDNLTTMNENLEAADSAMRDSDIAKEMTTYMKYAVLSQASQYMLAQAGQNAFQVLNLLQQ